MRLLGVALMLALPACRTHQTIVTPDPHLERMLKQQKVLAYDDAPQLPGDTAMQRPPEGTLPVDAVPDDPTLVTGVAAGKYAERIPLPMTPQMIEQGRADFETFCAACHGVVGDGVSVVADKMALRKPPDLHEAYIRAYPPGRIFQTIREGYGLMPPYAVQLSVRRAWQVVAYLQALELARSAPVADLPPAVRAELAKEAP